MLIYSMDVDFSANARRQMNCDNIFYDNKYNESAQGEMTRGVRVSGRNDLSGRLKIVLIFLLFRTYDH